MIHMKEFLKILKEIRDLLREAREDRKAEKEDKDRAEKERMLVEYAQKHNKKVPVGMFAMGRDANDRPINSGGELIPSSLSSVEKTNITRFLQFVSHKVMGSL